MFLREAQRIVMLCFARITKQKNQIYRGVAQLVARLLWEQDAGGSSPFTPTMASVLTAFERLLRTLAFFIQRVDLGRS